MLICRLLLTLVVAGMYALLPSSFAVAAQTNSPNSSDTCGVPDPEWRAVEQKVWSSVCRTGFANISALADSVNSEPVIRGSVLTEMFKRLSVGKVKNGPRVRLYSGKVVGISGVERGVSIGGLEFGSINFDSTFSIAGEIRGDLAFSDVIFGASVFMNESRISGETDFTNVKFIPAHDASCTDSQIYAVFSIFNGQVNIRNSDIQVVGMSDSTVNGKLVIQSSKMMTLTLNDANINGSAYLMNDEIGQSEKYARNCRRTGFVAGGIKVTKNLIFLNGHLDGNVILDSADVGDTLEFLLKVSNVDAMNARIGNELILRAAPSSVDDGTGNATTIWIGESSINLSNAHIGRIASPRKLEAWPSHVNMLDTNFTSFLADPPEKNEEEPSVFFSDLLDRGPVGLYSFQPYETISEFFSRSGNKEAADDVGYAGKLKEWKLSWNNRDLFRFIYLTFSWLSVGFGYRIWHAIVVGLMLVVIGAVIFHFTPESKEYQMPWGLAYSFDTLIPLIRLREYHYTVDIKSRARYYFYFHRISGWILGSFIVAGLGGFTK